MEMEEVETHLRECASCRGFAGYLQETFESVERSRVTDPDPYFYTRVKARIENQLQPLPAGTIWGRVLQPALFTLVLAVAVYTGVLIGGITTTPAHKSYAMENLDPLMNELGTEPLETFLMD